MTFIQVAYDVPDYIAIGLATGKYMRFGSVVRDGKEIIMHLKEVPLRAAEIDPAGVGPAVAAALKNRKVLIGLGTAVVALAATGAVAYWASKKKAKASAPLNPSSDEATPPAVAEYNEALSAYLEAIQTGTLTSELLDRLDAALEAVEREAESGAIELDVSTEQSTALVALVIDYTRKLAKANAVQLDEEEPPTATAGGNPIVDLRQWLTIQRRIIDEAA